MGRSMWVLIALLIISLALAGCGGSGGIGDGKSNGGGNGNDNGNGNGGNPIDPNIAMIGVWQPTSATEDGAIVKLSSAMMNWEDDWSYGRMEFRQNGTCYILGHHGNVIDTVEGTWESEQGLSEVTFEGETTELTWSETGNVMTVSFTRNGHDYETKWVRITDLDEQEPDLVKTWKVENVYKNDVKTDPADFFGFDPGSDTYIIQFLSNGDMILRELAGHQIVKSEVGTWATGGQAVRFYREDADEEIWGYVDLDNNSITFVGEDGDGDTVTLELYVWPPTGNRDANLVGAWRAVSATVNGSYATLAEALNWPPGVTHLLLQLWEDGTVETTENMGSTVYENWLGDWYTGTTNDYLLMILEDVVEGSYTIVGQTLTFNFYDGGDLISLKFNRVL